MIETLHSAEELEQAVRRLGFLPFFHSPIPGLSIEEHTSADYWFQEGVDGPWEWKGPVIREWNCTYGKFFCGKAGYVSLEWFPDWANYHRAGYRIDAAPLDADGRNRERLMYDTIVAHESLLAREIKALCGLRRPTKTLFDPTAGTLPAKKPARSRGEGFESAMTHLQMATLVVIADFEYALDKHDRPYGWGLARYTTPEALFGEELLKACGRRTPEESKLRIAEHLQKIAPQATEKQILKIIG
ncbi:MAG: hypothetical protein LBN24_07550 [Mediterranea sp.]|jgi:hypothetical protein|nr:hypothetical protein [Mediterranea sp.]